MSENLDNVDLKLLRIVNRNAHTPLREMGREVGLSISGVKRRLDRLYKRGIIQKYSALVDPRKYGLDTVAFLRVEVDSRSMREVAQALERKREVCEIHKIAGDFLMLKVRSKDVDSLNDFIEKNITTREGVKNVATLISMETYKETLFTP